MKKSNPFPMRSPLLNIFFLVILFSPSLLLGQNYLMDNDQDGLHSSVQISYNSFENYYALQPGYTFDGRLTFGFDIGQNVDRVNKLNSTVLRPNVSYLVLKQSEELPLSVDINAAYQYNYVSQVIFNARAIQFGAGVFHEISPIEDVKLIPAVFVQGSKYTEGPLRLEDDLIFAYGIETSILWDDTYYLVPQITFQEGINTISLQAGMFFGTRE